MVARTVAAGPVLRVQQPPAMILEPPKIHRAFGGYPTAPHPENSNQETWWFNGDLMVI